MDANEELIKLLTEQARAGDEAVAAVARVRSLCERWQARRSWTNAIPIADVLRALDGPRVETPEEKRAAIEAARAQAPYRDAVNRELRQRRHPFH